MERENIKLQRIIDVRVATIKGYKQNNFCIKNEILWENEQNMQDKSVTLDKKI